MYHDMGINNNTGVVRGNPAQAQVTTPPAPVRTHTYYSCGYMSQDLSRCRRCLNITSSAMRLSPHRLAQLQMASMHGLMKTPPLARQRQEFFDSSPAVTWITQTPRSTWFAWNGTLLVD